jgi:phospholipase C
MSWCGEIRYAIIRKRDQWRSELVQTCTNWADEGSSQCNQWADEGSSQCSQWADQGSNQCCDWWPCSWACDAFYWVAKWVCLGWYWLAKWVCLAWYWLAKWVCRVFAWVVYWILTIVAYLVWYVLWIPCHVFGGPTGPNGPIKHVFVLVLENRSFDHMLGVSTGHVEPRLGIKPGVGVDAVSGLPTTVDAPSNQTNIHAGTTFTVTPGAPWLMPVDPPHEFCDVKLQLASEAINGKPADDSCSYSGTYPPLTMAGFIDNYANQATVESTDSDAATRAKGVEALADLGAVMKCFTSDQVPVISTLAREFAVCDRWFSALPGPTWPNRFFFHAASSGGLDRSPASWEVALSQLDGYQFENGTIFDALDSEELDWHVYHGDFFPIVGSLAGMDLPTMAAHFSGMDDFAGDLQDADFSPAFIFIEPDYGHVLSHGGDFQCGNSQHPIDDVTRGEKLIKLVYESIRQSPVWNSSVLLVTYDEHGGFYDHVEPPTAVPPNDVIDPDNNGHGFKFDKQGVRVPAVIASPLIPSVRPNGVENQDCNLIDHTQYDHSSLPATLERMFGLSNLTDRDARANDFGHLMSAATPRTDAPWTLPDAADSGFFCDDDPPPPPPTRPGSQRQPLHGPVSQDALNAPITSTMRGFVQLAAIHDLRMNPEGRTEIERRVRALENTGQARVYLDDVATRLTTHLTLLREKLPDVRTSRTSQKRKSTD